MNDDETVSYLKTLGLNLYESRAYLALIKARELTAKAVGQSALIPQSRTYDVLESLARKGFALATPVSPTTYLPVPAAKILSSQYMVEKKKIQENAVKIQEEAQTKLESLRDAYNALTKDLPATVEQSPAIRDRVWVLQTRKNIESALIGLITESKLSVLRITKPPDLKKQESLDPFYIVGLENRRFLDDALKRKVKMRWLSMTREIPTFSGLEISEPPERRYIEHESDITEKFLLVDNRSVLLNLHDPASSTYGSVALAMESKAAASIFLDHFEKVWERCRPLEDVLPETKRLVNDVGSKLREIGFSRVQVMVYETLAKLGAVSRETLVSELMKKKVQPQESTASCDTLMRLGLVLRENTYRLLVVEHPANVKTALDSERLAPPLGSKITTLKSSGGRKF
jgi:HTH-type transcriptional regulator, sugar sensing transcriptional regulator